MGGNRKGPSDSMGLYSFLILICTIGCCTSLIAQGRSPLQIKTVKPPMAVQTTNPRLVQSSDLIRAGNARRLYELNGSGLTVAVLDTGLRVSHDDFKGRVLFTKNFAPMNMESVADVTDRHGHGTHMTGVIAANGIHQGIAPGARIISLKVIGDNGDASFPRVESALQWVWDHHDEYNISVVNLSFGDGGNYTEKEVDTLRIKLLGLRGEGVAVVVAAGNDYYVHGSKPGMSYPAIFPESISVGAVYDANLGSIKYDAGERAFTTGSDRITPYSQRLHEDDQRENRTDIFAPGGRIQSTGILSDQSSAEQEGTSQATAVISGVILLLQQHYFRIHGKLPSVNLLEYWLRVGGIPVLDGDDEDDNVAHFGKSFRRADVLLALQVMGLPAPSGFISIPTAFPSPANVGEVVHFSTSIRDDFGINNEVVWDFGDGMAAIGQQVSHIYPTVGTFRIEVVNKKDGIVVGRFSFVLDVEEVGILEMSRFNARIRQDRENRDRFLLHGSFPWPVGRALEGTALDLNVAGAKAMMVLDDRGRGYSSHGKISVRLRDSQARFTARFHLGNWKGFWALHGLTNRSVKRAPVSIPVQIALPFKRFAHTVKATYNSKLDRKGVAHLER